MPGDWVSSAISGAAGLLGTLFNVGSQQSANETNIQLAREQRDFYLEQWKRENAYNDPKAQMARLQAAGLNPALMYGSGASGLSPSASMADVEAARVAAPQVDPYTASEIAKNMAETTKIKQETEESKSRIDLNTGQIKLNENMSVYYDRLADLTEEQRNKVVADIDYVGKQMELAASQIQKNSQEILNMQNDVYMRFLNYCLKSKEVDALVQKYAAETAYTQEQLKYVAVLAMAKVRNLNSQTALNKANVKVAEAEAKRLVRLTEGISLQNNLLVWDVKLMNDHGDAINDLKAMQFLANFYQTVYGNTLESFGVGNMKAGLGLDAAVDDLLGK